MTNPSEAFAELKGRLDALEWAFREITGRDLIVEQSEEDQRYVFLGGYAVTTLTAAQDHAQTLVGDAMAVVKNAAARIDNRKPDKES